MSECFSGDFCFFSKFDFVFIDFLKNKVEEKLGLDLDGDKRIGGDGVSDKVEKATHIDLNKDGRIGAHKRPADGGSVLVFESIFVNKKFHL